MPKIFRNFRCSPICQASPVNHGTGTSCYGCSATPVKESDSKSVTRYIIGTLARASDWSGQSGAEASRDCRCPPRFTAVANLKKEKG